MNKINLFKHELLKWSKKNKRVYSWRDSNDPWKILLLEIIAQQTQLDRANIYYEKFIKRFPSPKEMSIVTKKEILSLWSGLGYNSRALRLHEASKILQADGIFASVVDMHTIKPLDNELLRELAEICGCFVTAEDHSIIGGLGSAVSEWASEEFPLPIEKIGVKDRFGESGESNELLEQMDMLWKIIK